MYSWLANTSATTGIVGSLGSVYPMAGTDGNRGMVVGLAGALRGISFLTNGNRQSTDSENEGRFFFFKWGTGSSEQEPKWKSSCLTGLHNQKTLMGRGFNIKLLIYWGVATRKSWGTLVIWILWPPNNVSIQPEFGQQFSGRETCI